MKKLLTRLQSLGHSLFFLLPCIPSFATLQYADQIIFLKQGRIAGAGPAPDIVTPQLVGEVFGITPKILPNPHGRRPVLVFN